MITRGMLAAALAAALAGVPGTAHAATLNFGTTKDGLLTLVYEGTGASSRAYVSTFTSQEGRVDVTDFGDEPRLAEGLTECTQETDATISCPMPELFLVTLGDGQDSFVVKDRPGGWPPSAGTTARPSVIVYGDAGGDFLVSGPGDDAVHGGPGDDTVLGGAGGDDAIFGEAGDDHLGYTTAENFGEELLFAGQDVFSGGGGADSFDAGHEGVSLSLDDQANDELAGGGLDDVRSDIENVKTGDKPDRLVLTDADNNAYTGNGDDFVDARGGNDSVRGWNDDDHIIGGPGIDDLQGESGNDVIEAADGELDSVNCGFGADRGTADGRSPQDELLNCEPDGFKLFAPAPPPPPPGPEPAPAPTPDPAKPTPSVVTSSELVLAKPAARVKLNVLRSGLRVRLTAPGAGKGEATLRRGGTVLGRQAFSAKAAGRLSVRVKLTRTARRRAARLKGAELTLRVAFTPSGGARQVRTTTFRVR